jgi:transposase
MSNVFFLGLEVDEMAFHGHLVSECEPMESHEFRCQPLLTKLVEKLNSFKEKGITLKICYEASYKGFSILRKLRQLGYDCEVIAPSHTPRMAGDRVKTDKVDAKKLALYYRQNLLRVVYVPDEKMEYLKNILRTRDFLVRQLVSLKLHILSNCRRASLNYKEETKKQNLGHWTQPHYHWLESTIGKIEDEALKFNLNYLYLELRQRQSQIEEYDKKIDSFAASPKFEKKVKALSSFRGIKTLTAMTLITEIDDIRRFDHPKYLTSYCGLGISEYSS